MPIKEKQKNPAAQALVKKRWDKTTKGQRSANAKALNEKRWAGHIAKRPASARKAQKKVSQNT
jgi:hypothetical protein